MKILILGSTGFVGRNLVDRLFKRFTVFKTSRNPPDATYIYFDLSDRKSWQSVIEARPDVIINATAYGVIKLETDVNTMYAANYFNIAAFHDFLYENGSTSFWLQLGTAFEYDLSITGGLTEKTRCLPQTHYGISKLMFSQFLILKAKPGTYSIFRPFGMFGKYEDESKFFPMLIKAQQLSSIVKLSAGTQQRDYFFVEDLSEFIESIIVNGVFNVLPPVVNLGSGEAKSLREYATVLGTTIKHFDPSLWEWEAIGFRGNESSVFYNSSLLATSLGFRSNDLKKSLSITTEFYLQ